MTDELKPCLAYPCGGVLETNLYDASLTCSRCQFQVADELEYNALVAGRQAAIDDEEQNPWKAAIIQELIIDNILTEELERDPRKALAVAIDWNCKVALDPSVSKEAQDLQQRAIDAALESVAQRLKLEVTSRGYDPDSVTMRYTDANQVEIKAGMADKCYHIVMDTIGTNPLADLQQKNLELARHNMEPDMGPWVPNYDGRLIQSDDFNHDVTLRVSGDFATDEDRIAYTKWLAAKLNATPQVPDGMVPAQTVLEWMEEAKEDIQNWACYASEYFREKHNLAADLVKMDMRIAILERMLIAEPPNMPAAKEEADEASA